MNLQTFLASESNVTEKLSEVLAKTTEPKLLLVYASGMSQNKNRLQKCLHDIAKISPVPLIGMTTSGVHFTEEAFAKKGFACGILYGDLDVQVAVAENLKNNLKLTVEKAFSQLDNRKSAKSNNVIAFADGLACDGAELAAFLKQERPLGWKVFGGMAGDDWNFKETFVFANGEVMSNALVLASISVNRMTKVACRHGFSPIEKSNELTITGLSGLGIKSLNDTVAVEKYRDELELLGKVKPTDNIIEIFAKYPIGIKTIFGEGLIIRTPVSVGKNGEVGVNAGIREGDKVRLMSADIESILESTRKLSEETQQATAQAALVFDCGGRYELIKDNYKKVVKEFAANTPEIPLIGGTTYGEIAVYGGNMHQFHNYTGVKVTI